MRALVSVCSKPDHKKKGVEKMPAKKKLVLKLLLIFAGLFLVLEVLFIKFGLREQLFESFLFQDENKSIIILSVFAFSIFTTLIGYFIAKKKKRSTLTWSILCFFLNIWGVLILLSLPAREIFKRR